jgi:hypothetical protein
LSPDCLSARNRSARGADTASKVGVWSGSLVLELLSAVPFLYAMPPLFHQLAIAPCCTLQRPAASPFSQVLPAIAILPFMLYQLAGFGTFHYVIPKMANWIINLSILCLNVASYAASYQASWIAERALVGALVINMAPPCCTAFSNSKKYKRSTMRTARPKRRSTRLADCPKLQSRIAHVTPFDRSAR